MPVYTVSILPYACVLRQNTPIVLIPQIFGDDRTYIPFAYFGICLRHVFPNQESIEVRSDDVIPTDGNYHLFVASRGAYKDLRKQEMPLPEIEGMLDYVYEVTAIPESVYAAEQEIVALKTDIVNLNEKIDRIARENDDDFTAALEEDESLLEETHWKRKRRAMMNARFTKQNQILLLRTWLSQIRKPTQPITQAAKDRHRQHVANLERRIETLTLASAIDPKDFLQCRRELTFLRRATGEIATLLIQVLEKAQHPLESHLLDCLRLNQERLNNINVAAAKMHSTFFNEEWRQ